MTSMELVWPLINADQEARLSAANKAFQRVRFGLGRCVCIRIRLHLGHRHVGVTASKNPIDAFIAADYKTKGLVPVGKADKLTLLRRVYFDLMGLPPSIADEDAFLSDQSSDAYEKVVDRLVADEQHG